MPPREIPVTEPQPGAGPSGPSVLLVDDDPDMQRWVETVLESTGCRVRRAADVVTGLMAVRSVHPDVIVLDLHLPGGGGKVFLERLRKLSEFQKTPVLILSANLSPQALTSVQRLGVAGMLEKPVSGRLFLQAVLQAARTPRDG